MVIRWKEIVFILALLWGVAWLVGSTLDQVQYHLRADEGVYLAYSSRLSKEGAGALPALMKLYIQQEEQSRFFPPPLRVVHLFLGAAAIKLGGTYCTSLAVLSLVSFLLLLVFLWVLLRKSFGIRTAVWVLLLAAAAPLHLALSRRALSDTLNSLLMIGSLGLFIEVLLSRKKNHPAWILVSLFYAAALLVKESALALAPLSLLILGWDAWRRKTAFPIGPACAVSLLPILWAGSLLLLLTRDIGLLRQVARTFASGAPANPYAQAFQGGPWIQAVVDWLLVSPWVALLYLLCLGALIGEGSGDERAWFWALIPVFYMTLACLFPYGKNVRFLAFLEVPMRICAVLLLQRIFRPDKTRVPALIGMGAAVAFLVWLDLNSFFELFVRGRIYDPTGISLLKLRGFIPG